jgi:hypothetical protein
VKAQLFVPMAGRRSVVVGVGGARRRLDTVMMGGGARVGGWRVGMRARGGVRMPVLDDAVDGVAVGVDVGVLAAGVAMLEQRGAWGCDAEREHPGDDRDQSGELSA